MFKEFLSRVESEWPSLKYLGFGFYYAWILVCYSSDILFSFSGEMSGVSLQTMMYIISTFSLAFMLIIGAIFRKGISKLVANTPFIAAAALIATIGTLLVFFAGFFEALLPLFYVGCCITGLATAFVALRFGMLHSLMPTSKVITYIAGSFLVAGVLYFVIIGIPTVLAIILTVLLPLLAALSTLTLDVSDVREGILEKAAGEPSKSDKQVRATAGNDDGSNTLPPKFFGSLIATVTIFAVITGFYTGLGDEFTEEAGFFVMNSANTIAVLIVIAAAVILLAVNCAVSHRFNLSRLYYPIIIFACCCVVIIPLFGYGTLQFALIRSAYTLFILFVWCLLTHTAHWSHLGSTLVFGLGRGASAFGTAVGWTVAMLFGSIFSVNYTLMVALSAVMVLVLAGVSMIVLREDAIRAVFSWSDDASGAEEIANEVDSPTMLLDTLSTEVNNNNLESENSDAYDVGTEDVDLDVLSSRYAQMTAREETWVRVCNNIATDHKLTNREREVLLLLGRRMTIEMIADELCVSFNTAKSHVRHVYDKIGVHSRKELFTLIDQMSQST